MENSIEMAILGVWGTFYGHRMLNFQHSLLIFIKNSKNNL